MLNLNTTISEKKFRDIRETVFRLEDEWKKLPNIEIGGVVHTFEIERFKGTSWEQTSDGAGRGGKPIIDPQILYCS